MCPAEPQILLAAARHVSAMFSWLTSAALLHLGWHLLSVLRTPASSCTECVLFNKPRDLVVTRRDELNRQTVFDVLERRLPSARDWHAAGRLDMNTTGMLLFTNDGKLVHHLTDGSARKVRKVYYALVHRLSASQLAQLRAGVELGGGLGRSEPVQVEVLEDKTWDGGPPRRSTTFIRLCLYGGKNRQIRRMLHAVGSGVMKLRRVQIGDLELGGLEEGAARFLTHEEVERDLGYIPRTWNQAAARGKGAAPAGRGRARPRGIRAKRARTMERVHGG